MAATLAAASLLVVTTGCAAGDGGGTGPLGDTTDTKLVITGAQAPWSPAYEKVVAAYRDATGVDVELRPFPNDEVKTQQLNDAQSGTHTFDVYLVNEVDVAQFNDDGLLLPFTDVDPDYALDPEMFTYNNLPYWDADARTFSEDGALTTAPLLGNLQIYVYRTDVFDQLGLDVPTTWEDAVDVAAQVNQAGTVPYGYISRYQGVPGSPQVTFDFMGVLQGVGGQVFADPGTDWTPVVDSPEAIRAAEIFRDLASYGPAETNTIGQAEAIAAMQAGDAASLSVVAAAAAGFEDEANSNVAGKVGFAPLPGGVPATGTWNLGIPADLPEERRQPALDFIDWVTSAEGMRVFAEAGGIPTRSDAFDAPGISDTAKGYLDAVAESAGNAEGPLRLTFIGPFLEVTEPIISGIAAGTIEPAAGMTQMQEQLTQVVADAGLPTK